MTGNPSLLVSNFADSLAYTDRSGSGTWAGVDPIRYSNGLWVEEGTTNYSASPQGETPALYTALRSALTEDTGVVYEGVSSLDSERTTAPGSSGWQVGGGLGVALVVSSGEVWTLSAYALSLDSVSLRLGADWKTGADGAGSLVSSSALALEPVTPDWERLVLTATVPATAISGQPFLYDQSASSVGATFHSTQIQFEEKPYATSPADGSMGDGYAWVGTPEQSASTRAASSASVATTGHIDPTTGSLAFRFRRLIDTDDIEYLLICGTDGDDRLRIYVNDDDYLHVAWDTGSAPPQYVISPDTIALDTEYFVYTYWDGTIIGMSIDNGTAVVGIRDLPIGSFGVDDLVLQAT